MARARFSNVEVITPVSSPLSPSMPSYGGRAMLSSQDRVLVDNGGSSYRGLDIYLSLMSNPVVFKSWDKMMSEICSREIVVEPGVSNNPDDAKLAQNIADFVKEQMLRLGENSIDQLMPSNGGVDALTRACGTAYITGISPIELVWGRNGKGKRIVQYFKPRDPRLVRMEYDDEAKVTRPKVITRTDTMRGMSIPVGKFIIHRHWAIPNDDDYGSGLGRNLYYPVEWQKQVMTYWLMLIDKTVMPSTVGSYSAEARATEELINDFDFAVRNFGQDSAIVLPPGFDIKTIAMSNNGIDMLEKLISRIDTYIETLITGESSTGKEGGGSGAKDEVANSIRLTKAKDISDSICDTLNSTIVKWLVWSNFGKSAPMPKMYRNFEADIETDPTTLAEVQSIADFIDLLGKLDQVAITLDKDYIQQRLGVPLKGKPPSASPPPAAPSTPAAKPPTDETGTQDIAKTSPTVSPTVSPIVRPERTSTALYDHVPTPSELLGG
jgi:phage gp29-like protein